MSKYPTVIVCSDLRIIGYLLDYFFKKCPCKVIKKGAAKYQIWIKDEEFWIMHRLYYAEWCKGRTYYKNGKLYHSDYELKGAEE